MNRSNIIILLLLYTLSINAKVLIFTHSHSRPDFIELQHKTFKAFLEDEYEFVVFNDAPNATLSQSIEQTCKKLNLRCIRIPQNLHKRPSDPGARHIDGIQFALNTIGFNHDGIVLMIDSDMFLFKPLNITQYVGESDLIGQESVRPHTGPIEVRYITPLLVFMNMKTLPNKHTLNFDGGIIKGNACDVGGHIYYYLRDNPSINMRFIPGYCITELAATKSFDELCSFGLDDITAHWMLSLKNYFDPSDPHRLQLHGDNHFLHYVAGGSNWNNRSQAYHEKKTRIINQLIDQMIAKYDLINHFSAGDTNK